VDALPQGGVVNVKTRKILPAPNGNGELGGILVEVRDNGVGIPPLQLNRAFDAFSTTKGPARSGLGLSIAYSLITQQGGQISVDSREGKGTAVTITLPHRTGAVGRAGYGSPAGAQRGLSILVVEDEPQVAGVYRTFLETFGHRVVACFSGADALEAFHSRDFHLALVDLGMPGMDGWEVSHRMLQQRPNFPIIVATGWNVSVEDCREQGIGVRAVLKKPFGMYDLDRAVQEALG
jgi:CheY-like chemotaxis protein